MDRAEVTLSRERFLRAAAVLGLALTAADALPLVERIGPLPGPAAAFAAGADDATLQAFADTIVPGRVATRTDLGDPIAPGVILGLDPEPGGVEADALRAYRDPLIGFDGSAPAFLADLSARSLATGARPFLELDAAGRTAVAAAGLARANPARVLYEYAAAVAFIAFCAGTSHPVPDPRTASGWRVMGHPGAAPNGYRRASFGRPLSRERTTNGSLR